MPRSLFRQSDLTGALNAARKAGFRAKEVLITPAGEIRLVADRADAGEAVPDDVAAEIARWEREHG